MSDVNDYEMFFAVHWTSKAEFILWCACFVPLWSAARALTWRLQILEGHYGPLFKPHHIEPGEVCFLARSWRTKSVHTTLHFEDVNPHEIAKKEQHFKNICSFLTHLKKITLLALAWNKMINYDAAQVNRTYCMCIQASFLFSFLGSLPVTHLTRVVTLQDLSPKSSESQFCAIFSSPLEFHLHGPCKLKMRWTRKGYSISR